VKKAVVGIAPYVQRYVEETAGAIGGEYLPRAIEKIVPLLLAARSADRTIFFFGNGGSASTASHFVVDIGKATIRGESKRFRCVALVDNVESLTAWANDAEYSVVFSEQLRTLGHPGDVAVGISGSGNSPNVLKAMELARTMKLRTIGLTGMGGGRLKELVEVPVVVPSNSMQHVEDAHLLICHLLTAYLRDEAPANGTG
jgi:D-sedoheptulose 7-phosphate isomerase